jgi:Zn-dependent protease
VDDRQMEKSIKTSALIGRHEDFAVVGEAFGTPIVVKDLTWLPVLEILIWGFTSWLAGRRRPERRLSQRMFVGALTMPIIVGLEWSHNFAHAAAASRIGKPMDALRITWGTPLVIYYDINDPSVSPRQHILRALGGPVYNALLLPVALFLRQQTQPESIVRDMADTAVGMNLFLCTVSMLPIPGLDGGPTLKWSLVERGRSNEEADQVVRRVNGVLGVILSIVSLLSLIKGKKLLSIIIAPFAALMLAIGSGIVRE